MTARRRPPSSRRTGSRPRRSCCRRPRSRRAADASRRSSSTPAARTPSPARQASTPRSACAPAPRSCCVAPRTKIFLASTGVIGVVLPDKKVRDFLPDAVTRLSTGGIDALSHAILTTDVGPKVAQATFTLGGKRGRIVGVAKGAGMIHPNMATMLGFVMTDAARRRRHAAEGAEDRRRRSFNSISVDGDTSTNDTVLAAGLRETRQRRERRPGRLPARAEHRLPRSGLDDRPRRRRRHRVMEIEVTGAQDRPRRETRRPRHRHLAARQDRAPRRRPELGPHPGRRRPQRRALLAQDESRSRRHHRPRRRTASRPRTAKRTPRRSSPASACRSRIDLGGGNATRGRPVMRPRARLRQPERGLPVVNQRAERRGQRAEEKARARTPRSSQPRSFSSALCALPSALCPLNRLRHPRPHQRRENLFRGIGEVVEKQSRGVERRAARAGAEADDGAGLDLGVGDELLACSCTKEISIGRRRS